MNSLTSTRRAAMIRKQYKGMKKAVDGNLDNNFFFWQQRAKMNALAQRWEFRHNFFGLR
jgi:hypothetical protein